MLPFLTVHTIDYKKELLSYYSIKSYIIKYAGNFCLKSIDLFQDCPSIMIYLIVQDSSE